jgi:ribonuclease BN (tRNA processing enzyme)
MRREVFVTDKLTVIGSGDAFNAGGRGHSCYLLEGEGFGPLMVDFGATALAGLRRCGREPTEIRGFAITHLHGDHVGGWPYLIIDGMFNAPRRSLLDVVGPLGVEERLEALLGVTYGDLSDHPRPFASRFREIEPGGAQSVAGTRVEGFAAEHMDAPERPLCLRVTTPSVKVVAFSGDTALNDGLRSAAAAADLLVAECSCLAHPCGRHSTWQDWRTELGGIGARRVLFTHLGREVRARVEELARQLPGAPPAGFADDGMIVEL